MGRMDDEDDACGMPRNDESRAPRLGTGAKAEEMAVGGTHYVAIRYAVVMAAGCMGAWDAGCAGSGKACNEMAGQNYQVRNQQRVQVVNVSTRP